jgi:hypothetical protein
MTEVRRSGRPDQGPALAHPLLRSRPMSLAGRAATSLLLICLAACGDGDADPDRPDAGPVVDAGPTNHRVDRAGMINLIEGGGFLSVFALIQDGPERPTPIAAAQAGECTVFVRPQPALCSPACTDGVCTAPGTCTPWPANVDVGAITVTGLRQPLRFVPGQFGYEPTPAPGKDLFAPGAAIGVSAPGATGPGFSVGLTGVADLTGGPDASLTLVDGQDTTVRWSAAGSGQIQLGLVVGWHGAPYEALLLCEGPDDGELVVPGGLIADLPRSNGLESHPSWMMRFDRAQVATPAGPLEVVVGSSQFVYFTH